MFPNLVGEELIKSNTNTIRLLSRHLPSSEFDKTCQGKPN